MLSKKKWIAKSNKNPANYKDFVEIIKNTRNLKYIKNLSYGDHGLNEAYKAILNAIKKNKKIALYADYDVDGTMSCVSWIWFFEEIGFKNFIYYIPSRLKEGYGLNMTSVKKLVKEDKAQVIITMDTGITANKEAKYCKDNNCLFICSDHHQIQPKNMPDCIILNPKNHPDQDYQDLCGCGVTFVLLRKLGKNFNIKLNTWNDLLSIAAIATVCDMVPLNGVNHKFVKLGVKSFMSSARPILKTFRENSSLNNNMDEKDIAFKLGPKINAVGRLDHANTVIDIFTSSEPDKLINKMIYLNDKRKNLQDDIFQDALKKAVKYKNDNILILSGNWHPGVVGIVASRLIEIFWKPVWLICKTKNVFCGSTRGIKGFNVTDAMSSCFDLFIKFGGHAAAGGFSFEENNFDKLCKCLKKYADNQFLKKPQIWEHFIEYDFYLKSNLISVEILKYLDDLKPFGQGFAEPKFLIEGKVINIRVYDDKKTKKPKHSGFYIQVDTGLKHKIMFFNMIFDNFKTNDYIQAVVTINRDNYKDYDSIILIGLDVKLKNMGLD